MTWGNTGANTPWSMTFGAVTGNANQFSITDTNGSTNTLPLVNINTVGTSTALPLQVTTQGTANGVQVDLAGNLKPIGTGLITGTQVVNAQTGTTYTFVTTDRAKLVTLTNASSIAVTLPQAGLLFPSAWYVDVQNRGPGNVTITPTTSTIDGVASIILQSSQGLRITSDGTNYFTQRGAGSGSGSPVYTTVTFSTTPVFTVSGTGPNSFKITLTANVTSSTLTNAASGQQLEFDICQDATGGRSFVFPTNVLGAPAIASGINACTRETFVFDGTNANFNGFGSGTPAYTVVSFSATPTFTVSGNGPNGFKIVLTGNVTSSTLAGAVAGQQLEFDICQDATGGRTFVFPTNMLGASAISSGANACVRETFTVDASLNANQTGADFFADNTWTGPARFKGIPFYDITGFGASGSAQVTAATSVTTASSTTVTLPLALDFKNGQGIFIRDVATGNSVGPNQAPFCSTIVSGGGTTTLVLATAPSISTSSGQVFHDDQVAVQAAIDAAAVTGGIVWADPGTYYNTCVPLHQHANNVRLVGHSKNSAIFTQPPNTYANGPGLVFTSAPSAYLPVGYMGTALMTGTGNALNLTGDMAFYLDLRNCGTKISGLNTCGEMNGNTSLTVEADVNLTSLTQDVGVIVSAGLRDSVDGNRSAQALGILSTGALRCRLNTTTSGPVTITGAAGAITTGSTFHLAQTYDGTNQRCFVNGVQVAGSPTAQTGTVVQAPLEAVLVGRDVGMFPDSGTVNYGALNGRVDGIRISNIARYTANFTPPTAKWGTPDANTQIQINFDNQPDVFTVGNSGIGSRTTPMYLPFYHSCAGFGGDGNSMESMSLRYNDGVMMIGGGSTTLEHLAFSGGHQGFYFGDNCAYYHHIHDVDATYSGRYGIVVNSGIGEVDHINTGQSTAAVPMVFSGGTYQNLFVTPLEGTQVGILFRSKGISGSDQAGAQDFLTVKNVIADIEAVSSTLQTIMMVDNIGLVDINGGTLDCSVANLTCSLITLETVGGVSIRHVSFAPGNSPVAPIHCAGVAPEQPVLLERVQLSNYSNATNPTPSTIRWVDSGCPQTMVFGSPIWKGQRNDRQAADVPDFNLSTMPLTTELPNDVTTGTFLGLAAKPTGASNAVVTAATDTNGSVGVVVAGAGKAGSAHLVQVGQAAGVFDNATIQNDYVTLGTLAGTYHDSGSGYPTSGQVVGRAEATVALIPAPPASSPTCASSGGTWASGTYQFVATSVNMAGGETTVTRTTFTCSTSSGFVTGGRPGYSGADVGVRGYRVYVSASGGASGTETLQTLDTTTCNGGSSADARTVITTPLFNACSSVIGSWGASARAVGGAAIPSSNTAGPLVSILFYPEAKAGAGGGGTPGGSNTQIQWNNNGAFAGSANVTYTSGTGAINVSQLANSNDFSRWKRFTDTAPTGFVHRVRNAADSTDLYTLDVLGNTVANTGTFTDPTVAGGIGLSQGTTSTTAKCPALGPNCILHQAPTAVTPYMITWPGVAAGGLLRGTTSGSGATLTNTIDYVTPTSKAYFDAAGCSAGTGSAAWDTAQPAVCNIGTNVYEGVIQFTATSQTAQFKLPLPTDWTGAIDARLSFYDSATSGTVTWTIATACTVGGTGVTDDTVFNTANNFGAITLGSPANALQTATVTGITTTGCNAGNWMQVRIGLSAVTGTANARGIELTLRRTF